MSNELKTYKVTLDSDAQVNINISENRVQSMSIRDAFLFFYSKINQFLEMNGGINIDILYYNFIHSIFPAVEALHSNNEN